MSGRPNKEAAVRAACARLGIRITRSGEAFVLEAPGVHVVTSDLGNVTLRELQIVPNLPPQRSARRGESRDR